MIRNIPTAEELRSSAIELLVMAWEAAVATFALLENSEIEKWDTDGSALADYHAAQQPALRHAHVWVHQAQELGLKANIAAISPYILLAGDPRSWPRPGPNGELEFNDFRTIDASDLIRVHDTVCEQALPPDFVRKFDEARRSRNKIVHLGGRGVAADATGIFVGVLETVEVLFPQHRWARYLMDAALNDPVAIAHGQGTEAGLLGSFAIVAEVLPPAMLRRHFGYDKRRRSYICLNCSTDEKDWKDPSRFAQLTARDSHQLFCPVCAVVYDVLRENCAEVHCRSNVLCGSGYEIGKCLLCMHVDAARFQEAARLWLRGRADGLASVSGEPPGVADRDIDDAAG